MQYKQYYVDEFKVTGSYVWAAVQAVLILVRGKVGLEAFVPSRLVSGGDPITFRLTSLVSERLLMNI